MKAEYPLLVIGAGPAGLAAARTAAALGIDTALLDEQSQPGGQIYRGLEHGPLGKRELLGQDYLRGEALLRSFRDSTVDYHADTRVWYLDGERELGILQGETHRRIRAGAVIVACGAQERPLPFPGWQLPGVMTAGAGQILLKSAAMVPAEAPVLAGSGPLLLLLAWQYLRAGLRPRALVETVAAANLRASLRHLPRALGAFEYLSKGLRLAAAIRRARIPWYSGAKDFRARGETEIESFEFRHRGGRERIATGLLLVHHGVIPATQLAAAADCDMVWDPAQQCWQVKCDSWGETSQAAIHVAGDAAAIGGARVAEFDGALAALQVACRLGGIDAAERDRRARPLLRARRRHLRVRPFLDTLYRVPDNAFEPPDDTLVCRCEEIDTATLRAAAALATGPNQVKAFTRCGMGPCQGRSCGATLEHICATARGVGLDQAERLRVRPPLKPITLGQLAGAAEEKK